MVKAFTSIIKLNFVFKVITFLLIFRGSQLLAQASITATNTAVTEAFTGYAGTSTLPANWTTSGSGANGNTFQGTGQTSGTAGGWYGNGNMSYLGSGSASNGNATWKLQNNTCYTITSFTVTFTARMWKSGSSSPVVSLSYSNNATGTVPAAGVLNLIQNVNDATPSIATGTTITQVVSSVSIANGDFIYLRFIHAGGSNSDNIGWDDVSIKVDGVYSCGCTAPSITTQPVSGSTTTSGSVNYTVTASGTSPSYQWQQSTGGAFSNLSNGGSNPTIAGATSSVLTISNPPLSMNGYSYQCVVSNACGTVTTNGSATLAVTVPPSITTGTVSSPPFALTSCTSTASGTVDFTSTGTFNAGNIYTAQLSNSSGSFASPTNIGTLSSTANSGTINITIPAGTASGSGYLIRVISSNPSVTGSSSSAFSIVLTCTASVTVCPQVTGMIVDGCANGGCAEGSGEALFLNSGSYALNCTTVSQATANVNLWYGSTASLTQTSDHLTATYVNNSTVISCLNSLTGCSAGSFIDALGTIIPANSKIMVVRSTFCCGGTTPTDFSSLCASGPIYVLFSSDGQWIAGGAFKNGPGSTCPNETRYLKLTTASISSSCSPVSCNYDACLLSAQGNGDYVLWSASGGSPIAYGNNGCIVPPVLLPINLLDFYGTKNGNVNELVWKVAEEENILNYTIEKSNDAVNFTEVSTVSPGNSNKSENPVKTYELTDENPYSDITYYRLSSKEYNGTKTYYKIISIDNESKEWSYNHYQQGSDLVIAFKNSIPKNSTVDLFDISGKELVNRKADQPQLKIDIHDLATGIYFVRITTPYKTENFKIVIQP